MKHLSIKEQSVMARALRKGARGTANAVAAPRNASSLKHEEVELRKFCVECSLGMYASSLDEHVEIMQRIYDWVTRP